MKVLVLGASGMLGHSLYATLSADQRYAVSGTIHGSMAEDGQMFPCELRGSLLPNTDARHPETVCKVVESVRPDAVINCIGLIKQGGRADCPQQAIELNALFPHQLAEMCSRLGARMIQISTDCVFSGETGNYAENDRCCPVDLYGRTKLLGEVGGSGHLTLRTSIIGHELKGYHGLLEWFLSQAGRVRGFSRAVFSGLTTGEFSRVLSEYVLTRPELEGVFHVSSAPISKYELLQLFASRYDVPALIDVCDDIVVDRSLDSTRFKVATGYIPPSWHDMIGEMYEDFMVSEFYRDRR